MPAAAEALRKAAILIDSLDAGSADALLEQMGEAQSQRVRNAVLELEGVTQAERDEVIAAFMGRDRRPAQEDDPGVEFDASLSSKFGTDYANQTSPPSDAAHNVSEDSRSRQAAATNESSGKRPFEFLHQATPASLASLLGREHPQMAALVVAHIAPELAARVLKSLPGPMQVEVLRRVVDLEETEPEILREVERQIEAMLSDELRANRRRQAGMVTVGAILAAAGGDGREQMLSNLASIDQSLASRFDDATEQTAVVSTSKRWRQQLTNADTPPTVEQPEIAPPSRKFSWRRSRAASSNPTTPKLALQTAASRESANAASPSTPRREQAGSETSSRGALAAPHTPPPFDFDDLTQLDDRSLIVFLNAANPELTLLALTGAKEQLVGRIARQLPRPEAQTLRRRMQQTGPLRLSDIEEARRQLAYLAAELAERGEIRLVGSRRFAVAA